MVERVTSSSDQISTRVPSSTTRLAGMLKKSVALPALRAMAANNRSRQRARGPLASSADTHYLRIYMKQLRDKLEADPVRPRHLLTESGVGYRLVGEE